MGSEAEGRACRDDDQALSKQQQILHLSTRNRYSAVQGVSSSDVHSVAMMARLAAEGLT